MQQDRGDWKGPEPVHFYCSNSFWWAKPAGNNLHVHGQGSSEPSSPTPVFSSTFPSYCFSWWLNHQINFGFLDSFYSFYTTRKTHPIWRTQVSSSFQKHGPVAFSKVCQRKFRESCSAGNSVPLWSPAINIVFLTCHFHRGPQTIYNWKQTNHLQLKKYPTQRRIKPFNPKTKPDLYF